MDFWTFFAFPLNLILALLWILLWLMLRKNHGSCAVIRFMLSPSATISSVALLLVCCLWMGFGGNRKIVASIPFAALLLYLQTMLFLVTLRGWRTSCGGIRWRFLLIHAGLLLAIGAGFWGYPDSYEARVILDRGDVSREVYEPDGSGRVLPYSICLHDFMTKYAEDGTPSEYSAVISIDDGVPVHVLVNHPHNVRFGEDIYIASLSENGCVLQIVREPWRYFALVGIMMLLAGAFLLFIKGPVK